MDDVLGELVWRGHGSLGILLGHTAFALREAGYEVGGVRPDKYTLVVVTDGLLERQDGSGEMFGEPGVERIGQRLAGRPAPEILDELRVRVPRVGELRDRLTAAEAQAAKLARLRQSTPSALTVLEVLSEQLDDKTWLQGFDLRDGRLTLRGISESPATLIETLEDTEVPLTQDVGFKTQHKFQTALIIFAIRQKGWVQGAMHILTEQNFLIFKFYGIDQ